MADRYVTFSENELHEILCRSMDIEPGRGARTRVAKRLSVSLDKYGKVISGHVGGIDEVAEWCAWADIAITIVRGRARFREQVPAAGPDGALADIDLAAGRHPLEGDTLVVRRTDEVRRGPVVSVRKEGLGHGRVLIVFMGADMTAHRLMLPGDWVPFDPVTGLGMAWLPTV